MRVKILKVKFTYIARGGAIDMPNIKSAIKRVSVIEKKTLQNNMIKTGYRTAVKKLEASV